MLVDSTMKELKLNFSVVNAKNGKEAVDMFKAYSNIKLVLMDI